jgi:predicted DNA-binding transcriptional regulator AlpA
MSLSREKEILEILPISHATLWRWVKSSRFPHPIKLSPGVTVWEKKAVDAWLESRKQGVL